MVAVAALGWARSAHPADWVPATAQIDEGTREDSAPADKAQASSQADLGFAIFPTSILPREPQPTTFEFWWLETDGCRPGHRDRIDRPPRREA
jgi:hypothetical protein